MPNPALLLVDSDALIQVFIADAIAVLRRLKFDYGVQPVVVPEVENEVGYNSKWSTPRRFQTQLRKAISSGVVAVLDSANYAKIVGSHPDLQVASVGVSYADIETRGARYNRRVDPGEAYTFAAAHALNQPAVSNDFTAIKAMQSALLELPRRVLRSYDLIVFGFQAGILSEQECSSCRSALLAEGEWVPKGQAVVSFTNGLTSFEPRLVDMSRPTIGVVRSLSVEHYSAVVPLVPLRAPSPK